MTDDRYNTDPKRKEYTKRKAAEKRERVKSDPLLLEQQREYMRNYRKENVEHLNAKAREYYKNNNAKYRLERKGIPATEGNISTVEEHSGKCDICGKDGDGKWKTLNIDHCHSTKKFRGMLCANCNRGLGYFQDDPELLARAIEYLKDR